MTVWTRVVGAAGVRSSSILNIEPTSFTDELDVEWREKASFCFVLL